MLTVFLSYSRNDGADATSRLREELGRAGFDVWRDIEDMRGGVNWKDQLGTVLKTIDVVLVLLTPQSTVSPNVEWEWRTAMSLSKPIIPVLIAPCTVPDELRDLHYRDLSHPDGYSLGLMGLIGDLSIVSRSETDAEKSVDKSEIRPSVPLGTYSITQIAPPNIRPSDYSADPRALIEIRVEENRDAFNEKDFINALSKALSINPDSVRVIDITEGSVWLTIELPLNAAQSLYHIIGTGLLKTTPSPTPDSKATNIRFLNSRDEVIQTAISMFEKTTRELFGKGEDLDWIRTPGTLGNRFQEAFENLLKRMVFVELISSASGEYALETARKLEECGASLKANWPLVQVFFKRYGHSRVLVSDRHRILIAFNAPFERAQYFGLYLESVNIGGWLRSRHDRLKRSDDIIELETHIHRLENYEHTIKTYQNLKERDDFVHKLIELIANAQDTVVISSRRASWILDDTYGPQIEEALKSALISNGVSNAKILVSKNDKRSRNSAKAYRALAEEVSRIRNVAPESILAVRYLKDFGQTRIAMVDRRHVLLAFPHTPNQAAEGEQQYIPYFVSEKRFADWLSRRFDAQWFTSIPIGISNWQQMRRFPLDIWCSFRDTLPLQTVALLMAYLLGHFYGGVVTSFLDEALKGLGIY